MNKELLEHGLNLNRRRFLSRLSIGLGSVALGSLLIPGLFNGSDEDETDFLPGVPHFAPHAKRVIYLFQNGAPSQLESFDYKPLLTKMIGKDLPASVRMGQRLTGMTADQKKFPLVGSFYKFNQYGNSGAWVSELFPETAKIVDDLCIIRVQQGDGPVHHVYFRFLFNLVRAESRVLAIGRFKCAFIVKGMYFQSFLSQKSDAGCIHNRV